MRMPLAGVRRIAMLLVASAVTIASLSAQESGLCARVDSYLAPYVKGKNSLGAVHRSRQSSAGQPRLR